MTDDQKAQTYETMKHIARVGTLCDHVAVEILARGRDHDRSKLESPEMEAFAIVTPRLASQVYGTEEYKASLREIRPAIQHHYSLNRHHPEYHANGLRDMTLIDLMEMLADWKASSERGKDGSLAVSLPQQRDRFKISDDIYAVLENTATALGWIPLRTLLPPATGTSKEVGSERRSNV